MYPPPPFSLVLPPTLYVTHITHYLSFYSPFSISLQDTGQTALMYASWSVEIEAIKLLLVVPGINVNHADVSLCLLTPSYLALGGGGEGDLPHFILPSNPRNDDLSSPSA